MRGLRTAGASVPPPRRKPRFRGFRRIQSALPARRGIALAPAVEAADATAVSPLANLLAGNVIPQGELVHLLLKPSRWFILLNSLRFAAVTTVAIFALHLSRAQFFMSSALCLQLAVFLVGARVMWSVVQWMGRYYLLTDLRVVRVSGVFDVRVQSCRLRKVDTVNLYSTVGERVLGLGCVEILGGRAGEDEPAKMTWQTLGRPARIHRAVAAAVARAKSNGSCA